MHDNLACVTQIHTVINTLTLTIAIYYMTLLLSTWLHTYIYNNFLDIMFKCRYHLLVMSHKKWNNLQDFYLVIKCLAT